MALLVLRRIGKGLQNYNRCSFRLFLTQFLKKTNFQSMGGTGPDTGRFQIVFPSDIAEIALGHLSVFRELWSSEGTDELATMAPNTEITIDNDGTVFLPPGYCSGRTHYNTGSIPTVLTGKRKMKYACLRIFSFLIFRNVAKGNFIIGGKIVLVLTDHNTGHTTGTTPDIERKSILAHLSPP
jgi:hypothetical protein